MAKALGHSPGQQDAYSKQLDGWSPLAAQIENATNGGGGIEHPIPVDVLELAEPDSGFPASPGYPFRGNGDLRPAGGPGVPGGMGADGKSLGPAVGQGRLCRNGVGQIRSAGPRHALRPALRDRPGASARGDQGRFRHPGSGGTGGLRDAAARRFGGCFPGRIPRPDGHPAQAQAPHLLRPGRRGRADPARSDPGRLGAPVHPAPQRAGTRHLRPPGDGTFAGQDPGDPAVPGAVDATGGGRRRASTQARPTNCDGRWAPNDPAPRWRS